MAIPNLNKQDALILVDIQNDFCPGGNLPVEQGDQIIPIVNQWINQAQQQEALILATRDWHPEGHISFQEQGGEWPIHCIQGTHGAEFHPDLNLPDNCWIVNKGHELNQDQYSAFHQSDLAEQLKNKGIQRVWVAGLAEDVCVRQTALDCLAAGFETHVIQQGTRPVFPNRNSLAELQNQGAFIETDHEE